MSERVARPYRLRAFRAGDHDALLALWERSGLLVAYNDPEEDLRGFLEALTATLLVIEQERALVGAVAVGHDGHRGWLYYLAVAPEVRRRGLGSKLVRAAERWLLERGLPKVQLMVRPDNAEVQRFYEKLGYEVTPRLILARWLKDRGAPEEGQAAQIETVITYLEMTERPTHPPLHPPANRRLALLHAERPPLPFYRYLYDRVGERWLWWERRILDDAALAAIVHDPKVEIFVLYVEGNPAGFAELDRRAAEEIELAYFGLLPEFLGQGLGPYLLQAVIEIAWDHGPRRVTVHTNKFDHPKALALYQRLGFRPYRQERHSFVDPRPIGIIPS